MFWLYWNRWRPAVLAASLSLACIAAIVIAAGSVVGGYEPATAGKAGTGRTGTQARHPPLSANSVQARRGVLLMRAAAIACQNVAYRGVQMVAWWGPAGGSTSLIQVWHRSGGPELAKETGDSDPGSDPAEPPQDATGKVASGVLSVPPWMLSLMRANYEISYVGPGSASDRPAHVVAVRRGNGTLAAQYWLDASTNLPLRREVFDSGEHLVNEGAFIDLHIGDRDVDAVPAAGVRPWSARSVAHSLAALRAQGWSLPASLAGDLALVGVTRTMTPSGWVVDASYSDGLSVVSVFTQRGELEGALPGWHLAAVQGKQVYSAQPEERSFAWSAGGLVYTVLADAPPDTVQRVVVELPHQERAGFWQRVSSGLRRMVSWLNPFG